jgi:hypothetical protein
MKEILPPAQPAPEQPKRPRGRPRKSPAPAPEQPKRPRGQQRKYFTPEEWRAARAAAFKRWRERNPEKVRARNRARIWTPTGRPPGRPKKVQ